MPLVLIQLIVGIELGGEVAACGIGRPDFFGARHDVDDFAAERVNLVVVRAHAFQHDLPVDVDHVGVAHPAAVHDVGHLHARLQFVALHIHGKDADVAGLHVLGDLGWKVGQRTRRKIFQHEGLEGRAQLRQLLRNAGGDVAAGIVGDERDLLVRLDAQAGVDRVAGAGRESGSNDVWVRSVRQVESSNVLSND